MARTLPKPVRRLVTVILAMGATVATFLVAVPSANATAAVVVTPSFPASATVGQSGLTSSLSFTNASTSPDDTSGITVTTMAMVLSCGSTTYVGNGNCPSTSADPGVFQVSAGTGDAASACAGVTFTVKTTDTTTGRVAFTPSSSVVLTQNQTCTINFTVNAAKYPVHPVNNPAPNQTTTEQFTYVAGTNTLGHPVATITNTSAVVAKASPSVVTTASGTITIGGSVNDSARLSNGASPTGTITFSLYGPNDGSCAATAAYTVTLNVGRGNATYFAPAFTPTVSGTYVWVASYSGDNNNSSATDGCGASNESVTVNQYTPSLSTQASAAAKVGGTISDSATLSGGGLTPTGTITFNAYGPDDPTCSGAVAFTSTVDVTSGNGTYPSAPFTTTAAGTYTWTASYSGDVNNAGTADPCGAANESVGVSKYATSLSTQASAGVIVGGAISDSATLSGGGNNPSGTITFTAYGPGDPTCAGGVAFTSTVDVTSGNGTYSSDPFTPTLAGTYTWTATYSGDAANTVATDGCGGSNESVTVAKATPSIVTQASITGLGQISDDATVSGGDAPSGTVTFTAFGPADPNCSHTPAYTSTVALGANGEESSGPFTLAHAGTYVWVASYNGDVNNNSVSESCGAAAETVTIPMIIATASLPAAPVERAYKKKLVVDGGSGTKHWSVTGGALPAGLKLSGTGVLAGTPTTPGDYSFTVTVRDSSKPALTVSRDLSLAVTPMSVATTSLPDGTVGITYAAKLTTSGGKSTFHWTVVSGALPAGLALSGSGALSGKPTTPGTATFTVRVTDSTKPANVASQTFTITVAPMTVTTTSLPAAHVGVAYATVLVYHGGFGTHRWNVVSGSLPPGLTLTVGGKISGKPTTAGSYSFTVQVADSAKPPNTATQAFALTVS